MWDLLCDPNDLPVAMETKRILLRAHTVDGFLQAWYLPGAYICKYDWKAESMDLLKGSDFYNCLPSFPLLPNMSKVKETTESRPRLRRDILDVKSSILKSIPLADTFLQHMKRLWKE